MEPLEKLLKYCEQSRFSILRHRIGPIELFWLLGSPNDKLLRLCDIACCANEHARAARYLREQDRLKFRFRRGMLRYLLADRLKIDAISIAFGETPYGKLTVAGSDFAGTEFNCSHSGEAVAFAFGDRGIDQAANVSVGIDIERHRDLLEMDSMARIIMHDDELRIWRELPQDERVGWFFNLWSLKEAVLKCIGCGLSLEPSSFSVRPGAGNNVAQDISLRSLEGVQWRLTLQIVATFEGFSSAIAIGSPHDDFG